MALWYRCLGPRHPFAHVARGALVLRAGISDIVDGAVYRHCGWACRSPWGQDNRLGGDAGNRCVFGVPRIGRGSGDLSLGTRGYVVQARLAGMSPLAIARWHYLPALLPSLTVIWTGMFARAILGISTLGFLGFGVQPPMPEWGAMLLDGRIHMRAAPLQMIWPGMAIVVCVLAINLAGDALRDALAKQEAPKT